MVNAACVAGSIILSIGSDYEHWNYFEKAQGLRTCKHSSWLENDRGEEDD